MMVLLGLAVIGMTAPSAVADQPNLPKGDITVSFPGFPGICYTPCTVIATDTLPPEKAVNVVRREWWCQDSPPYKETSVNFPPMLTSTDVTVSCSFTTTGPSGNVSLTRFYVDGSTDGTLYGVTKRDPADAPAPIDVQVPASIVSPRDVIVVKSPKKVLYYDWWGAGPAGGFDFVYPSRQEGTLNVFELRLHAPQGKVKLNLELSNIPGRNQDRLTINTTVARYSGEKYFGFKPEIIVGVRKGMTLYRSTFEFVNVKRVTWRLTTGLQRRSGGKWTTLARRSKTGPASGSWAPTRAGLGAPRLSRKRWTQVRNAACEKARYRAVASYTLTTPSGKTLYHKSLTKKLTFRCNL
jgi:hypothetical protein